MKNKIKILAAFTAVTLLVMPLFCAQAKVGAVSEFESDDILRDIPASATVKGNAPLEVKAKSAVLMEPHTGKVLYSFNAEERLAPASITKIMSLLLVMEDIESGKLSLDTPVTTSDHAASMGGSQIWLEVGEVMTVDELLRASVIASANDATVALAEAVAGSEEAFVGKMNDKAKKLGMTGTNFVNACGLDADGHLTTGMDVAIMASELIKHDLIKKYSTVWMDALRDGKSELTNTNKLVRYYSGATGLKTGTTSKAGCSVAATAMRDGMELVAVIMGSENSNDRFVGAKKLLDYGYANWAFLTLTPDLNSVGELPLEGGMEDFFTAEAGVGSLSLLLEKGRQGDITQKIELKENITAPIKTGDIVGSVKFILDGEVLGELPIVSVDTVEKANFLNSFTCLLWATMTP